VSTLNAVAGQAIPVNNMGLGGVAVIREKCHENQGNWACASCGESFPNNLTADGHYESPGDHLAVWWCALHGPEEP
jgi:hypothetical protein